MQPIYSLSTALIAGIMATVLLPPAAACGYHGTIGNYFSVMYPSSLVVAVALKRASDEGVIDLGETRNGTWPTKQYLDAVRQLNKLQTALAKSVSPNDSPPSFSLGFIESGLWTRYSVTDGQVRMEVHVGGPAEGDAVVLTAEPVLARMLSGALPSEDALSRELIVIDAPITRYQALHPFLTGAFLRSGEAPSAG